MLRFFGQPKFTNSLEYKLIGYELFLRQCNQHNWGRPLKIPALPTSQFISLLDATLKKLPIDKLSFVTFTLEQPQFIDPALLPYLATLNQQYQSLVLAIKLIERPYPNITSDQLLHTAKKLTDIGFVLCLDDIDTENHPSTLVDILDPYIVEYKIHLQYYRDAFDTTITSEMLEALDYWTKRAERCGKQISLEGIESLADLQLASTYHPNVLQGYLLGRPKLISLT